MKEGEYGITPKTTNWRKSIIERSALRRKSILNSSHASVTNEDKNDDEAERSLLLASDRSQASSTPLVASSPSSVRSADMASSPVKEHFQGCLKLYAENKINKDNAWNLQLIDFMTTMLRKHDARMDNLQMASTVVDASTRIYSFRVDAVHHEVLKMAGGISKATQAKRGKRDDDPEGGGAEAGIEEAAGTRARRKKKGRGAIATNEDQLCGDLDMHESIDPFFERLAATSGDVTSSNRAFYATLPIEDSSLALLLRTDKPYLTTVTEGESDSLAELSAQVRVASAELPALEQLDHICEPFTGFSITNWNPDDEDDRTNRINNWMDDNRLNTSNQELVFDVNAEVQPIPLDEHVNDIFDDEPLGGIDSEEEGDVAVAACIARAGLTQVARLTDMRPAGAADVQLEYSYSSNVVGAWAGPSHWKLKNNLNRASKLSDRTASTVGRHTIEVAKRAPAKQKRHMDFVGEGMRFVCAEHAASEYADIVQSKIMISRKTLSTGHTWNEKNFKTPVDRGLTELHFRKLFLKESVVMALKRELSRRGAEGVGAADKALHVDEGEVCDYDYQNENDTSYCPQLQHDEDGVGEEADAWLGEDAAQAGDLHQHMKSAGEDGLGDMVEPPSKVAKIFIPYAMRAKKVDMKQLKNATWRIMAGSLDAAEESEVVTSISFHQLYEQLPSRLSGNMRDSLSVSLSLLSVLHLANEKGLVLEQHADFKDFTIVGLIQNSCNNKSS